MTATGDEFAGSLSEREAQVLRFMLSADDPRLTPLRGQAEVATVVGRCDCGCATIELAVDRGRSARAPGLCSPVSEAKTPIRKGFDWAQYRELILFLDDGWLLSLEIIFYCDEPPKEFPRTEEFEPPIIQC